MFDLDWPYGHGSAQAICTSCIVQRHCLADGLGNPFASGVYGGVPISKGQPVTNPSQLESETYDDEHE